MENAKQKAIEEAYGEHWEKVKNFVDENGWVDFKLLFGETGNSRGISGLKLHTLDNYSPKYCYWKRPIELDGIEANNNWISIHSEEDLPKEDCECFLYFKDGSCYTDRFLCQYGQFTKHHWMHITHYQKINLPSKPIY